MRILILMNMYPPYSDGGYPLLCEETVEELKCRNHDVLVLTSTFQLQGQTSINNGIWRIFDYCPDNLNNELKSTSLTDLYKWYRREWQEQSFIKSAITQFKPDCCFVWATKGMSYSIAPRLFSFGLPVFAYVCGYWLTDHNNLGANRRQYQFWNWGKQTGLSKYLKNFLQDHLSKYLPLKHQKIIFDGLAFNDFETISGLHEPACKIQPQQIYDSAPLERFKNIPIERPSSRQRILFIGRLHPSKDPITLIQACKSIQLSHISDISLSLVGWPHDDDYLSKINHEIATSNDPSKLQILQPVAFNDMPALYASHDIIVVPSEVDPLPRVAAEGMAAGLPLIVSNATGISKCLKDHEEALIFPAHDVATLIKHLTFLLTREHEAQLMAKAGRKKALDYFSTQRMVDEIEQFLMQGMLKMHPKS
ncbi:glycosyltransferase family 4 protein [Methylomonas lenta]|nr:glycosyltransferase family 4 protein [Methylomonas lenta]